MTKNKKQKLFSNSPKETQKIASDVAQSAKKEGGIFALIGDLGAGKTVFVQGFAKGLGIEEKIISPTFVLIRQHPIPQTNKIFYHIDLYRLEDEIDLLNSGLKEIIESDNVILIEWADKIKPSLPKHTKVIKIKKLPDSNRILEIHS